MARVRRMEMSRVTLTFVVALTLAQTVLADVEVAIDEELSVGSFVIDLTSERSVYNSLDAGQIPFMTYGILDQNNAPANLFRVDRDSGEITVARRIDREAICDPTEVCQVEFNLAVQAGPDADVAFSNVVTARVVINDINDNAPTFPSRDVTLEVSEGAKVGTELKISGAVDRDSKPQYTVRHYNHTPSLAEFSVRPTSNPDGSSTINLRLERELDREVKDSYIFNIIAYDGGETPQSDYLRVTVLVTDDNDNSPMFNRAEYPLTVNENEEMGSVIGQVTATDKDIGNYGKVQYSFSKASESSVIGVFAINSSTGVITLVGSLDDIRRSSSPFFMYVDAKDGGDPPRSNQTLVSVTILDSENNAPFVRVDTLSAGDASTLTIPESASVDYFVAFVEVTDYDMGDNGQVACQLAGDDFKLSPVNGKKGYTLLLNRDVDRETQESYQVLINCADRGIPPLDTSVTLMVNISDENDNDPKFHEILYSASVPENRLQGHFIARVSADDADFGPNADITYSLPNEALPFLRIHPRSGIISTARALDRETNDSLKFEIYASDNGKNVRTGVAEIIITVTDENDNEPTFTRKNFFFDVYENTANGTVFGALTAYDNDSGSNGIFDFHFGGSISGDMPLPFTVLKNGSLMVSGLVDRESTTDYSFSVLVRDRGVKPKTNMVPVVIKLLDENDNDPVILYPTSRNHSVVISTYPGNDYAVGRVIAYDVDEGDAAKLRFSLYEGNEDGAFSIDSAEGHITLSNMAKLRNPHDYYLSVKVEDATRHPRNATTELRVEINFENTTNSLPGGNQNDQESRSRDKYVIIVGVIGGATVVLSIIIISAIIIILQSDRRSKNGVVVETSGNRGGRGGYFKNKFIGSSSDHSSSHDTSKATTDESLDGTKSPSESSLLAPSDPHGLLLNPGTLGSKRADDVQKKVSFSLDVQDDFHDKQIRMNVPANLDHGPGQWKKQYNAQPDDLHSDTSGESGTCDSGRGTSDEDIKFDHSPNRGVSRQPTFDPFMAPRGKHGVESQYSQQNTLNIRPLTSNLQGHDGHQSPMPFAMQGRPQSPINNSLQGTGRTDSPVSLVKPGQPRFMETGGRPIRMDAERGSFHGRRQAPPHPVPGSASMRHPTNHRVFPAQKDSLSNPDLLRPGSAMSFTHQGSALSMDDDNASTTTSGSYVINPDDVRLDGLLGKDVIV